MLLCMNKKRSGIPIRNLDLGHGADGACQWCPMCASAPAGALQHGLPGPEPGYDKPARTLRRNVEFDVLSWCNAFQQRLVLDLEIHGHCRPLEAGDRAVGDVD